mmetsp:Transcript_12250/g.43208  ORF Transcript_12250/g.43208 Transcript_12250/m.43208 type:complete len:261 (-) Transcript_12250:133-915(-)
MDGFRLPLGYTACIVILTAAGKAGDALGPAWVESRPLTLLALNANDLHLGLTVPGTAPLLWFVIGTLRRLAEDPVFFLIGWHYRDAGLRWLQKRFPGSAGRLEQASSAFRRFSGLAVVLEPGAVVCLLAGASRMQPWVFFTLNISGTVARLALIRVVAAALPRPLEVVLGLVRRFSLPLLLLASTAALLSIWGLLRGASGSEGGDAVDQDPPAPPAAQGFGGAAAAANCGGAESMGTGEEADQLRNRGSERAGSDDAESS